MKKIERLITQIEDELFGIAEEDLTTAEENIQRHIERFREDK